MIILWLCKSNRGSRVKNIQELYDFYNSSLGLKLFQKEKLFFQLFLHNANQVPAVHFAWIAVFFLSKQILICLRNKKI